MYFHPYSPMFDGLEPLTTTPTRPSFLPPSTLLTTRRMNPDIYSSSTLPLDLSRHPEDFFSPIQFNSSAFTPVMQPSYKSQIPNFSSGVSTYGIQTSGTLVDPSHNSMYLKRLHSNPMFSELQSLLAEECLHMQVPTNLINSCWSTTSSVREAENNVQDVFPRHMKLQEKFIQLRSNEEYRHDGLRLESEYSAEVGQLEVARYQALCAAGGLEQNRKTANTHFDEKRLALLGKYEQELENVILKKSLKPKFKVDSIVPNNVDSVEPSAAYSIYSCSNNEAQKPNRTVARQLKFQTEEESDRITKFPSPSEKNSISSCASSPECLQIDLSQASDDNDSSIKENMTMLGDSGVCDDTCSENSDNSIDILQRASELCGIIESKELPPLTQQTVPQLGCPDLNMIDITRHEELYNQGKRMPTIDSYLTSSQSVCRDETYINSADSNASKKRKCEFTDNNEEQNTKRQCSETSTRNQGRQLNTNQADILTSWYNEHICYPYPSDLEVQQLSESTGLQIKQVKKWMANKRVRCFNTLSISGNQHPIKLKFKGKRQGDKEVKKPAYQQLHMEARKHLSDWYDTHAHNPYPTDEEKEMLAKQAGITVAQVKSWFANKRSRTNNTRRQVPNYFINKFPEYQSQVEIISISREIRRQTKRQILDVADEFLYRL